MKALVCGSCLLGALLGVQAVAAEQAPPKRVIRFVLEARNAQGMVRCALFDRGGWLKTAVQPSVVKPVEEQKDGRKTYTATCVFSGMPAGEYAASAFHDQDNNGKLNTGFLGIPTEDYCASNNARGSFGPPSFDQAKFSFKGGTLELRARLR